MSVGVCCFALVCYCVEGKSPINISAYPLTTLPPSLPPALPPFSFLLIQIGWTFWTRP